MKTLLASAAVALVAVSGLAAHAYAQFRADWQPSCKALGCIEPDAGLRAPEGAELTIEQCNADKGIYSRYRYERRAEGWALVGSLEAVRPNCER